MPRRASLLDGQLERPGAIKLYLTWTALGHRCEQSELYRRGEYLAMQAEGPHADEVVAFARRLEGRTVVAVASRLVARMMGEGGSRMPVGETWESTSLTLPAGGWTDRLTGRTFESNGGALPLAELFGTLPVALLESS